MTCQEKAQAWIARGVPCRTGMPSYEIIRGSKFGKRGGNLGCGKELLTQKDTGGEQRNWGKEEQEIFEAHRNPS